VRSAVSGPHRRGEWSPPPPFPAINGWAIFISSLSGRRVRDARRPFGFDIGRVPSKGRYGRTREITIDASENVVENLFVAVQMNFDLDG